MKTNNETSKPMLSPTMRLRWLHEHHTYKVFFKKHTYKIAILQQLFVDSDGNETWKNIDIVDIIL